MTTQRRLGRGLEALLGQPFGTASDQDSNAGIDSNNGEFHSAPSFEGAPNNEGSPMMAAPAEGITHINVYEVDANPFQPRRDFDESEIESLAQSIRDHGLIQP